MEWIKIVCLRKDNKKGDNMSELIKVRKSYEGLTIVLPKEICERLNIVEGSQIDIEPYNSAGEFGARIKLYK